MNIVLELIDVNKKYHKNKVLDSIDLIVNSGEIIGLVGENGAGKSTLLNVIATLQKPTSGKLIFNDLNYKNNIKKVRTKIGYIPQEIAIWEHLTVKENMLFFEKLSWKKQSEENLRKLCIEMNLTKWNEKASTLSGGMKRKLNLAISLIHEPELLLLDEPTVGIDLKSKKEISAYLKKIVDERNITMIYISHDMDEIKELCDKIYLLGEDNYYEELLTKEGLIVERL